MSLPLWLTADQAVALLNVQRQTLYANVSRGRIRAKADSKDPRRSLYYCEDVKRLAARAHGRRTSETVARQAIEWGDPVMPSSISTVAHGRLWYRGQDACDLAQRASLEEVAALLWDSPRPVFTARQARQSASQISSSVGMQRGVLALAERATVDAPSRGRPQPALQAEAADLMGVIANAILGKPNRALLHQHIATCWRRTAAADLLRRLLVLMAEHELNASTFAARVTASTGASLASSTLSGMVTLAGPLHGGAVIAAHAFLSGANRLGGAAALKDWIGQGRPILVFGHPMYSQGDVRAKALLEHMKLSPTLTELRSAGEDLTGEAPNIDFAAAALVVDLRLPAHALLAIYALARSVGWLAHALEQRAEGHLIRPRAHYIGPAISVPT